MVDEITLESIFEKETSALTQEEVEHLNEHRSQLTEEQLEKFASVLQTNDTEQNDVGTEASKTDDETST